MAQKSLQLPESELAVIQVMWDHKTCTASEIREALNRKRKVPLAHATVVTLIQRLEAKHYVEKTGKRIGKAFVYRALLKPEQAQKHMIQKYISRFVGENPVPIFSQLLESSKLSLDDIQEIRKMLKEQEDKLK